ncbi:hypothetical protein HY450_00295 [Candidatus Pacearchaeota archaeon]|nr:hypothetical protein [Candidatus Pacearchaeota archaeon]
MNKKAGLFLSAVVLTVVFVAGFIVGLRTDFKFLGRSILEEENEKLNNQIVELQDKIAELQLEEGTGEEICLSSGGSWRQFTNSCVDYCPLTENEEVVCAQAITEGCDCGEDMCWNGEECEAG